MSPFFVLIHLTTLAFAFLFSLSASIAFLVSSIAVISAHLYYFFPVDYQSVDNVLLIVYVLSLITIVPISFFVARRYDLSNKLANFLNRELFISQTEKNLLLKSIQEGVITTDTNLTIVSINNVAQKLIKLDENALKNKAFFDVFSFENKYGVKITKEDLSLQNLLKVQTSFKKESLKLIVSNGIILQSIDLTISSNIDDNNNVIGIIFIFRDLTKQSSFEQIQNVIEVSFKKFIDSPESKLKKAMIQLYILYQFQNDKFNESSQISDINEIIKKQTQDYKDKVALLFDQKVSSEMKIGNEKRIETTYSIKPMSIVTNTKILESALYCLTQLAIDLNSTNTRVTIDSNLEEQKIIITIKTNSAIPKGQEDEITKPFFGKLENNPAVKNAIGIEGYTAKTLAESLGGKITLENENGLVFKLLLPYLRK